MTYKFKYHPDGWVGKNGKPHQQFKDFIVANPKFPITEGEFFEVRNDGTLELIKEINGTFIGFKQTDLAPFKELITAIGE